MGGFADMEIIMFYQDRKFIENKYHKTDEPFNPHARMAYHGYNYDNSTGLEDNEIKDGLTKLYEKTKALPHPVAKANAVKYVLENTKIDINEHDFFVGFWSINRLANCITQNKWEADVFKNIIPEVNEQIELMNASGAVTILPDFDHVVPDWESIMQLGFSGLLNRVKEYKEAHRQKNTLSDKTAALFDGIIIEYTAIIDLLDRLYKYALTKTHSKAKRIAECLKNIRDGAPQNIYDAMQTIYIYFMLSESFDSYQVRSLGNGLDRTLYSFYCNDLKKGTFSRDDIKELLKYFLMQWQAIGNYWGQPFYLGGTAKDGSCIINDLSNDIIDVYTEMGIYNPKIQIKINTNTPIEFLNKILCAIRKNQGSFVFCCEPGMMRAVMGYGATYEEARTMDIRGCYETGVRANEVSTGVAYINAAKAVEYVFSQGYDKKAGKQVGLKSPPVNEIKSFEEFYSLVLMQWDNLIEISIKSANVFEQYLSEINPSLMYSATIEGSLKKGADAYQCGVKYNNSCVLNCSFATLLDSVTTVYELVYEKKLIALTDLKSALDADWNGYEELHTAAKNCTHKYGNGDDLADMYATAMSDFFCSKINNRPNARGGGITLSGGECLLQSEACCEILKVMKQSGINTAVDTCGFVPPYAIERIMSYTDIILYDIKAIDEETHIKCTGRSNKIILDNLAYLDDHGAKSEIRIPFVPEYNDNELYRIGDFLSKLNNISGVRILPYHNYAASKYESINIKNTLPSKLPSNDDILKAKAILGEYGLKLR